MRTEIYIENQSLDLYKDISAEFTYNIDDVKDFSSRNTNFSKTIVIPGNATNNKLFGHIFEFGNSNFYNPTADNVGYNFNAAKSAACVVYVDKIQIFKGIIRLLEIIIDNGSIEYECAVFGELGGFVSAIANGKIEDLDFSAYNHVWNVTNITNSWNQVDGSGYFYPLIDYGQVSVGKHDWQYKAFRPALFVREYIDKIITGAGYTWESSFFNTNLFKRLVIPNNQKDLSAYSNTAFKSDILSAEYQEYAGPYYAAAGSNIKLELISTSIAGSFTSSLSNTRYTYTGASTISITANVSLSGLYLDSADTMYFAIVKNGSTEIAASDSVINQGDTFDFTFSGTGTFATNDYFEIIAIRQDNTLAYEIDIYSGNIELNTDVTQAVVLNRNELIQINKTIPRGVFQKDFFSSIVKMFNLYVTESTDKTKHLIISPYIDYYDFNDTIDWSLKIDRSKPFRLKPMSELNGRFFEYKYKQDADFYNENYFKKYNEGYGDFIEDTGYEFANERQTAEIVFAATPLILYAGDDKVHSIILKRSNTQSNNPSEDKMDSVIRILQAKKITGVDSYKIEDGTSNLLSTTTYGYAGHLDDPYTPAADINFGAPKEIYFTLSNPYPSANLFNGYWGDYVAEISDKDSKLLTCNVRLTDVDIYNLDFSRPIWIDGSLWRLNKVMDYNPMVEDTTKCEFIKVIEKTYA
jgi:hypothetical protein